MPCGSRHKRICGKCRENSKVAIKTKSDNDLDPSSSQEVWETVKSCICLVGQAHRQVGGLNTGFIGQASRRTPKLSCEQMEERNGQELMGEPSWPQWYELYLCSQGREPGPSFTQLASSGFQIRWSSHKNPTLYTLRFPKGQKCVISSVNFYLWLSIPLPTPALYPRRVSARTEPQIHI